MSMKIQMRRDTAANWTTANPVLASGEWGVETDTGKTKLGDGTAAWNTLPYKDAGKQDVSEKGAANGYAGLDASGKVPAGNLPDATTDQKGIVQGATDTEVQAGTDETKYVNSKQLKTYGGGASGNIGQSGLSGPVGLASSTLPAGTDGALELVVEVGLFRFFAASTDPVDGETCIAPASGGGRWILIIPDENQALAWIHDESAYAAFQLESAVENLENKIPVFLTAAASLDFPSLAARASDTLTIAVPGAAPGDIVTATPPALAATITYSAYVSDADAVAIRLTNIGTAAVDPAAQDWTVKIIKEAAV